MHAPLELCPPRGPLRTVGAATTNEAMPSEHDGGCFVVHTAVPRADDTELFLAAAAPTPPILSCGETIALLAPAWVEPTSPPGMRRAFFQVYRMWADLRTFPPMCPWRARTSERRFHNP